MIFLKIVALFVVLFMIVKLFVGAATFLEDDYDDF